MPLQFCPHLRRVFIGVHIPSTQVGHISTMAQISEMIDQFKSTILSDPAANNNNPYIYIRAVRALQ